MKSHNLNGNTERVATRGPFGFSGVKYVKLKDDSGRRRMALPGLQRTGDRD